VACAKEDHRSASGQQSEDPLCLYISSRVLYFCLDQQKLVRAINSAIGWAMPVYRRLSLAHFIEFVSQRQMGASVAAFAIFPL
jgi:hypothetical protein